jgi:hypothetical protein
MLSVAMLNVVMLSAVMLSVIMLSVVMLNVVAQPSSVLISRDLRYRKRTTQPKD